METKVNETAMRYMDRFYEPKVTAYEFLKYFFAFLKKEGLIEVRRNLLEYLYNLKKTGEVEVVLDEISFRSNGVCHYSNDIDDALFNLQNGKLLGKMNPSFGVLINKYTDDQADVIISSIPPEYTQTIKRIADDYITYQADRG